MVAADALGHMHVKPHGLAHFLEAAAKHLRQHDGEGIPLRVAQEEVPMAGRVDCASGDDRLHTRGDGLRLGSSYE